MFFRICALLHGNGMTFYSVGHFVETLDPTLAVKHPQKLTVAELAELLEVKNGAVGVKGRRTPSSPRMTTPRGCSSIATLSL